MSDLEDRKQKSPNQNENVPNLKKETDFQLQEVQRVPNNMNPKRPTPRNTVIKMAKVKDTERIQKAEREKQSHKKEHP